MLLQGRENVRRITGSVVPRKTEGEIKDAFESRLIEDRAISLFPTRQNSGYPRSRRQLKRYSRSKITNVNPKRVSISLCHCVTNDAGVAMTMQARLAAACPFPRIPLVAACPP